MANEAVLIFELESPIPFTVGDTSGIEKGTFMSLLDPMTASGTTSSGCKVAGIAATEKIASDGRTKIGCFRRGIFKVALSGACLAGDALKISESINHVNVVGVGVSGSSVMGTALETGASGETILMELNIGGGGNA